METEDLFGEAITWLRAGHGVAVATVVRTWGSSPRPAGSQLVVRDDGLFLGSVSGGCVEGAVVQAALELGTGGAPRTLEFSVSNARAWDVGLACGGTVEVLVQPADSTVLEGLVSARLDERPTLLLTDLETGEARLLTPDAIDGALAGPLAEAARRALERGPEVFEAEGVRRFLHPHVPPPRLVIVGAVHIAQSLVRLARELGFRVTLLDPRRAFADAARFPALDREDVIEAWPEEGLASLGLDANTAVVTLTHDPKLDDPALRIALASEAFFIGALGSRTTHASRVRRLREAGLDDAALARISGPVGLAIGARSPAEIALSILSEVVQARRCGNAPRSLPAD